MKKPTSLAIIILLIMSFSLCVLEFLLNLQGEEISASTDTTWAVIFFITTIFWAYYDADRDDFEKPFDFGFFIYVFWYIALPWYLIKTRGLEGILVFIGFITIWLAPWLSGLIAYVYFT